jgi:hypothetical protein
MGRDSFVVSEMSSRDGLSSAVLFSSDGQEVFRLRGGYFVGSDGLDLFVGCGALGRDVFVVDSEGARLDLGEIPGAALVDPEFVTSGGVTGGSAEIRGEEWGVVHRDGQWSVHTSVVRVTAMNDFGIGYGLSLDGMAVSLVDGSRFAEAGVVISVSDCGDGLLNHGGKISIWRHGGGVEAVPIRGYTRATALSWSASGSLLGFGILPNGAVQHWVYDPRVGLSVLTGVILDRELELNLVGAMNRQGDLLGVGSAGGDRYLVRLTSI